MKVLFVASGNKYGKPGAVVKNQADSLKNSGVSIEFFLIKGSGLKGYLKNRKKLKQKINHIKPVIVHAHGLSSLIATLTLKKPLVASLLGSEVLGNPFYYKVLFAILCRFYWNKTIVKTKQLENKIGFLGKERITVIPNGVDLNIFFEMEKAQAKKEVGFSLKNKTVIFLSKPTRKSKNFELAKKSIELLNYRSIDFKVIYDIPYEKVPAYLNAANVLLLTSLREGSPNIVKEAMACNCIVVATSVGDVELLFGNEPGHFLATFEPEDVAEKIKMALEFSEKYGNTNGRKRLIKLGLDSESIVKRIINVYYEALNKK